MNRIAKKPLVKLPKSHLMLQKSIMEDETKSSSRINSIVSQEPSNESIIDSEFGSISEGTEAQKVPQLLFTLATYTSKSQDEVSLHLAVSSNDIPTCKALLSQLSKPNVYLKWEDNNTLLHIASEKGYLKICELLLDYADINQLAAQNNSGSQPLHLACKNNHLQVVQLLIRSGADINSVDNQGNTVLHLASSLGLLNIISWILTRGPNILLKNNEFKTPEELANKEAQAVFSKYSKRTTVVVGPSLAEDQRLNSIRNKYLNDNNGISTQDFLVLKELGKGSFGEVFLVMKEDSKQLLAMKVLQKERIIKRNLIKYAVTERNVLSYMKHPFIVSLKYAFQTAEKLFLVLDYCPGGDLATRLKKEKRFSEEKARFYLTEIILALEELHNQDIIYRDLKPDNIVLDAEGHAMLTDFGLSKENVYNNCQATSFCGSLAYLAPEIIKRQGHGKALDWYLLGVVFYEMLVGSPPYFSNNKEELFNNIQRGKLKIPCNLSPEAKDLIKDLLVRDPSQRLGACKDAEEVKKHHFFTGVDWSAVLRKDSKPFQVKLQKIPLTGIPADKIYGALVKEETNKIVGWTFVSE